MSHKPDTRMQSHTSPWTELYENQVQYDAASMSTSSHESHQDEVKPTYDALEDVYNGDFHFSTSNKRV